MVCRYKFSNASHFITLERTPGRKRCPLAPRAKLKQKNQWGKSGKLRTAKPRLPISWNLQSLFPVLHLFTALIIVVLLWDFSPLFYSKHFDDITYITGSFFVFGRNVAHDSMAEPWTWAEVHHSMIYGFIRNICSGYTGWMKEDRAFATVTEGDLHLSKLPLQQ